MVAVTRGLRARRSPRGFGSQPRMGTGYTGPLHLWISVELNTRDLSTSVRMSITLGKKVNGEPCSRATHHAFTKCPQRPVFTEPPRAGTGACPVVCSPPLTPVPGLGGVTPHLQRGGGQPGARPEAHDQQIAGPGFPLERQAAGLRAVPHSPQPWGPGTRSDFCA